MRHDANAEPTQPLLARVERISLTEVPQPLSVEGVRLTIHARTADLPAVRYLDRAAAFPAPGCDLVAVITLGTINSPDVAQVREARLVERRVFVDVCMREFEGRLAANVQRFAFAIVELGQLEPGSYDGEIRVDRHRFTDYDHPERARFESSSSYFVEFEVAEN